MLRPATRSHQYGNWHGVGVLHISVFCGKYIMENRVMHVKMHGEWCLALRSSVHQASSTVMHHPRGHDSPLWRPS